MNEMVDAHLARLRARAIAAPLAVPTRPGVEYVTRFEAVGLTVNY